MILIIPTSCGNLRIQKTESKYNLKRRLTGTYQPFLVALKAIRFQLLNSNHHSTSSPCSTESVLINPPFVNITEASFTNEVVRPEIPRSILKLT